MDARKSNSRNQFDLIFSNAALHWVDDHEKISARRRLGFEARRTA
jgi:trans-aconitate methyltransferase